MKVGFDPKVLGSSPSAEPKESKGREDFLKTLEEAIKEVNRLQLEADEAVKELSLGKGDLHETILALEKADISFRLMMQIRNKLIRAYEEVMKMPL